MVHIRVRRGYQLLDWAETIAHRGLLSSFVRRDLTLRYRQTLLGVAWVVLQPLLAAGILTVVFSRVAKLPSEGQSYLLIALSGSVCWTAFSGVLGRTSGCLVGNAHLISKIYFPRVILPLAAALGALVDAAAGVVLLLICAVIEGPGVGLQWVTVPFWILICAGLALGPGLALSSAMVRFRDVAYVLPIVIQLGLYITPVGYLSSAVPSEARGLVTFNPLAAPIDGLRHAILKTAGPSSAAIGVTVTWLVLGLVMGLLAFRRAEGRLADVI